MRTLKTLIVTIAFSACAVAQRTTLDGVYSEVQAERGAAVYRANCVPCHGEFLQGKSDPPLRGDNFVDRWREDSLNTLYTHVRTRMPPRLAGAAPPGSLKQGDYLDLVSFILHENSFPAGPQELTAESVLGIQFVGKDGPQSLPTNAQAVIVGCLASGPNNTWMVTSSSEPLRTRNSEEITAEELKFAAARPLGALTFRLRNVPDFKPGLNMDDLKGHRVAVKGALIRQPNNDRITVLAMESAASSCGL
jgi:mono/diheme cytochrome c family protein